MNAVFLLLLFVFLSTKVKFNRPQLAGITEGSIWKSKISVNWGLRNSPKNTLTKPVFVQ